MIRRWKMKVRRARRGGRRDGWRNMVGLLAGAGLLFATGGCRTTTPPDGAAMTSAAGPKSVHRGRVPMPEHRQKVQTEPKPATANEATKSAQTTAGETPVQPGAEVNPKAPLTPALSPSDGARESGPEGAQSGAATHNVPAVVTTRPAAGPEAGAPTPGTPAPRQGDEIVVAGQFIHTGTPVVLWLDPGGYDAYRVERRSSPWGEASWQATQESGAGLDSPNRYEVRTARLTAEERERVRGGGWDLPTLQRSVDQFVIHYDVAGSSRQCFKVLHDLRGLSVHFLLDLDGTIYQTLDVKERARHASGANDRSIGIEIANIGAYPTNATGPLAEWYARDTNAQTRVTLPARFGDGGLRTANFLARPARSEPVTNSIHGQPLVQYDFTPEQYRALAHLTAALCRTLPEIRCDAPRDTNGVVRRDALTEEELATFRGVLGHFHLTTRKVDPGPAFDWERVLGEARRLGEQ